MNYVDRRRMRRRRKLAHTNTSPLHHPRPRSGCASARRQPQPPSSADEPGALLCPSSMSPEEDASPSPDDDADSPPPLEALPQSPLA